MASNTAIVKTADTLFYLKDDAELMVIRPSLEKLDVIRRYFVADSATWAQPLFSGKAIFVKDTSTLARWTY